MEGFYELQIMRYYASKGESFMVMPSHQDETSQNDESTCARKSA